MGKFWTYCIVLMIGIGCGVVGMMLYEDSQKTTPSVVDPAIPTSPEYTITFLNSMSDFNLEISSEDSGYYTLWSGDTQLEFVVNDSIGLVKYAPYTANGYSAKITVFSFDGEQNPVTVRLISNSADEDESDTVQEIIKNVRPHL